MTKKKTVIFIVLTAIVALVLSAVLCQGCTSGKDSDTTFSYSMTSHDINCDINTDCSLTVTETVTLKHFGRFTLNIPVEDKVRVRNVRLCVATFDDDGNAVYSDPGYSVTSGKNRVVVKADDGGNWEDTTYVVTYSLKNLPLTKSNTSDYVDFTLVGTDWNLIQTGVNITVNMPDGYIDTNELLPTCVSVFTVTSSGTTTVSPEEYSVEGNTFTYTLDTLSAWNGIRLRFFFENGVLANNCIPDILPWMLLLIGAAIVAGAILLKIFVFGKRRKVKINAHGEADKAVVPPDGASESSFDTDRVMQTEFLDVRRILERKVERRDVVSLLLLWANEGYISFNVKNANNPVIVQNVQRLPDETPDSWKRLFREIFIKGDRTTVQSLGKNIVPPVRSIINEANAKNFAAYNKTSIVTASLCALVASIFVSFIPTFLPMRVSSVAFSPIYTISIIPAMIVFVFMAAIYASRYRLNRAAIISLSCLAMLVGIACVIIYVLTIPDGAYALGPRIIASILTLVAVTASATLVSHSDGYTRKRDEVTELEEFIQTADADEIGRMIKDDPRCYYRILPYALVLRKGIAWGDKFRETGIPAPEWLTPVAANTKFTVIREDIKNVYDMILNKTDELDKTEK